MFNGTARVPIPGGVGVPNVPPLVGDEGRQRFGCKTPDDNTIDFPTREMEILAAAFEKSKRRKRPSRASIRL